MPWLIGGSADLAPSTMTLLTFDGARRSRPASYGGRNLHFGIREHGMAAALNGMALVVRAAVRRHVLRVQRLPAAVDAAGGDHGAAGDLRLHARLDRRGRRRPDASADRALRGVAGDSRTCS